MVVKTAVPVNPVFTPHREYLLPSRDLLGRWRKQG